MERTALAWRRTCLSLVVGTAVLIRLVAARSTPLALLVAVIALPSLVEVAPHHTHGGFYLFAAVAPSQSPKPLPLADFADRAHDLAQQTFPSVSPRQVGLPLVTTHQMS